MHHRYGSSEQYSQLVQALNDAPHHPIERSDFVSNSAAMAHREKLRLTQTIPLADNERLAFNLTLALEQPSKPGYRIQQMGPHFRFLPSRLGCNDALDAALDCFLCSYNTVLADRSRDTSAELSRYSRAIGAIRRKFDNTHASCVNSETLCAALLLAQYEILRPSHEASDYVALAGGVSAVFEACGPDRVMASDFEHAIFASMYPTILTQFISRGEKCYLNVGHWVKIMRKESPNLSSLTSSLWSNLSLIADALVETRTATWSWSARDQSSLVKRLCSIRIGILAKAEEVKRSLCHPDVFNICPEIYRGPLPASMIESQSRSDSLVADRIIKQATFFHSAVIQVNVSLQSLMQSPSPALERQISESADFVLATMNFAETQKPFGAWYMSFIGPLCYGGLSDQADKEVCLLGMRAIFDDQSEDWTHESLQDTFEAFTIHKSDSWYFNDHKNVQLGSRSSKRPLRNARSAMARNEDCG
jgi:hypothetical protein